MDKLAQDRHGFRLRGMDMTRIETFTDAAFAFAVTLLVISTDAVPSSYQSLSEALLGVPAFALAFTLIMSIWWGHWNWSRRFGLEDGTSILLSCCLVFIILVFVYPLKFLATLLSSFFSGGRLATGSSISSVGELYDLFVIYGVGYVGLAMLIVALNAHALRIRDRLDLDDVEIAITRSEIRSWLLLGGVGSVSVALALFTPRTALVLPGWAYMLLPVIMPLHGMASGRELAAVRSRTRSGTDVG